MKVSDKTVFQDIKNEQATRTSDWCSKRFEDGTKVAACRVGISRYKQNLQDELENVSEDSNLF